MNCTEALLLAELLKKKKESGVGGSASTEPSAPTAGKFGLARFGSAVFG